MAHLFQFERQHRGKSRLRRQQPAAFVAQRELPCLHIMRIEKNRAVPIAFEAQRRRHAKEMIAVDQIDPWKRQELSGQIGVLRRRRKASPPRCHGSHCVREPLRNRGRAKRRKGMPA